MNAFPRLKESAVYRTGYFLVSLTVLLLDQWTKGVVMRNFQIHESREIIPGLFDMTYVQNSGAAFGLFASVDSSIKAVVLNSVAVLVFVELILGGAVGNLLDRVRFTYVVDFLDFSISGHHWPAFNLADSAICIGVGLLFLDMLQKEDEAEALPPAAG